MDGTWTPELDQTVGVLTGLLDLARESTVGLRPGELLADVAQLQRVISVASAVQSLRLAQFAARDEVRDTDGKFIEVDRGLGHVADYRSDDAAPVLALPPSMAARRVHTAARLATVVPATLRAVADGVLDPFRAQIVVEETLCASKETCGLVEDLVYPVPGEITPGTLRRRVRRAVAAVDPEAVKADAGRSRQQLFVQVRACDVPGVSEWFARLSTEDSVLCWAAINEAAHQAKAEDPTRAIDQCRAETLADLILGRAEVTANVVIPVPVCRDTTSTVECRATNESGRTERGSAFVRHGEAVAGDTSPDTAFERYASGVEVRGVGIIQADVARRLLDRFDITLAGMLVDAATGATAATTSIVYRPPARIKNFVRLRDGTCRFPGCGVAARRCDLDHVVPWPTAGAIGHAGRTEPGNLICLCRRHHRLKTQTRWSPILDPVTAEVTWTDPYGDQWLTTAVDHRQQAVA